MDESINRYAEICFKILIYSEDYEQLFYILEKGLLDAKRFTLFLDEMNNLLDLGL